MFVGKKREKEKKSNQEIVAVKNNVIRQ